MPSSASRKQASDESVSGGPGVAATTPYVINAGGLQLDCQHQYALINDKNIPLAPIELSLLRSLLEARGRVVSRILLFQKISDPSRPRPPKLQSVDVHIKRLRQKLGAVGHSIITVRNVGYRFEICREWIDQDAGL